MDEVGTLPVGSCLPVCDTMAGGICAGSGVTGNRSGAAVAAGSLPAI
jgi:hypothetical protein